MIYIWDRKLWLILGVLLAAAVLFMGSYATYRMVWLPGRDAPVSVGSDPASLTDGGGDDSGAVPAEQIAPERTLEIELDNYYFEPQTITLRAGEVVRLVLWSEQGVHSFSVEGLGIDLVVGEGDVRSVTLAPAEPGTYRLRCSYHSERGMIGRIVVHR